MPERLRCFVIMPYSEASDEVYQRAVLPALRDLRETPILVLRADQMVRQLTLKAHVESAVQSADFCVADVTEANPNVMYELGYAMANQKPVFLICQSHSLRGVPSDLHGRLVITYDREHLDKFRSLLSRHVADHLESLGTGSPRYGGGVFSADLLSEPTVLRRFVASARYSLSALVSSPRMLLRQVLPQLALTSKPELLIRVICADPEGEFANARARHSGVPVSLYRAELWAQLGELVALFGKRSRPRAELRLTSEIIATSLLLSDDVALVFPYLAVQASHETAGIELLRKRDPRGFDMFRQQFGMAWSLASSDDDLAEIAERGRGRKE